ncbi:MAG TPA: VWA domain-containing protein, partial [Acidobacteriota bacterium]|nr:VWA domain-containing protein [Acidobacteriota bacterium]
KKTEFQKYVAVNYMLLDVIVTDRSGNYVHSLTKDDFEIFENGRKIEIESIDEYQMIDLDLEDVEDRMAEEMQPAEQPPRNIVILFDLFYSSTYGIKRAVETAEEFILNRIETGDNVMVLSYYQGLRTIQPFTSDKFKVIRSLREMGLATDLLNARSEPPSGRDLVENTSLLADRPFEGQESEGSAQSDIREFEASMNVRNYLLSMQTLAKAVKFRPGRKTVIVLSEGINFDLIDPTNINLDKYGPGGRLVRTADRPAISVSRFAEYKDMVEALNDAKLSLYTINVGGLTAPGDAGKRMAEVDSLTQQADFKSDVDNRRQRQDFLSSISLETGGRAYFNANDILQLLNRIEVDISNYYILGYRTNFDPIHSEYRKVTVKTIQPGLKVLHRKGFYTPRPFKSLDKDEKELHLTEGFLSRSSINELDATVTFDFVRPSTDKLDALICMEIPFEALTLDNDKLEFEVLVSNLNDEGNIFSSVHKLYSNERAAIPELQAKDLRIVERLNSDAGFNRIRIALRDYNSGKRSYYYYNYRFMPEEADDSLLLSQPLFFDPDDQDRTVNEFGLSVQDLEMWNENPAGGYDYLTHPTEGAIFPLLDHTYSQGAEVNFLVVLRNLQTEITQDSAPQFQFAISPVPGENAKREYYRVNPGQQVYRLRTGGLVMLVNFPLGELEPGEYDLLVFASEKETARRAASAGRLKVIE